MRESEQLLKRPWSPLKIQHGCGKRRQEKKEMGKKGRKEDRLGGREEEAKEERKILQTNLDCMLVEWPTHFNDQTGRSQV